MDVLKKRDCTEQNQAAITTVSGLRRSAATAGAFLLLASVCINLVLAYRVQSFHRLQSIRASEHLIKVMTMLPPIVAKRLDGQQEVISYQDVNKPTILYIFTPSCGWCARNMDNFKVLLEKEGGQYRLIGISLSEKNLSEYVGKNDLKLPVYFGLSAETVKSYKLGSTPQTIVISSEGKVLQDWAGAYVGDQKSQIEAFFRVKLPGLKPAPMPSSGTSAESSRKTVDQRPN